MATNKINLNSIGGCAKTHGEIDAPSPRPLVKRLDARPNTDEVCGTGMREEEVALVCADSKNVKLQMCQSCNR